MLSKKEIKDIQSLGLKKHRDESGLFVAEGPKVVGELLQIIPSQVQALYATKDWMLEHGSSFENINTIEISDTELERISTLQTPNKVVAVFKQLPHLEPGGTSFTLYLDTLQDPGNFGTIIRTADWFGIKNIVCSKGCADVYNSKVVQSTMASIARVNIFYDEDENWLSSQTMPLYATTLNGTSLYEMQKTTTGVLLVGNESKGLRQQWIDLATKTITIPRKGGAESLNAAVATGIILSHILE